MKAMLFAAGFGTRLKPFTNNHPKALATVNNKSLLQRNIEYLQQFGINEVIVNVHHFAEQIIETINQNNGWGTNITISHEVNEVLETGGGLENAAAYFIDEPHFVVMNVDILTNLDINLMLQQHLKSNVLATLAVSNRKSSRNFLFNESMALCGWKNDSTGEIKLIQKSEHNLKPMAFCGIHIINNALLSYLNKKGKYSIIDVYLQAAQQDTILAYDCSGYKWIDVGKPESIGQAEYIFV